MVWLTERRAFLLWLVLSAVGGIVYLALIHLGKDPTEILFRALILGVIG